jgi:hypothetical protein
MRPQFYVGRHKISEWFVEQLGDSFRRLYGGGYSEYPNHVRYVGSMAMELIGNSDALYHDLEHSMMVTLCGQEIIRGKHLSEAPIPPDTWLHFVVSLLCHDIGYVRGICPGDQGRQQIINAEGETIEMPLDATDAFLTPYHVERGLMFVRARFRDHPAIDAEIIAKNIATTQFPVPPDEDPADAAGFPGLVRAADLIGQLGDPDYVRKLPALFHEFRETGSHEKMGYENPKDLADGYPNFFWGMVYRHIQPALGYLRATHEGREWVASLYSHIFAQEHRTALSEEGTKLLEKIGAFANSAPNLPEAVQYCLDQVCAYARWPVGHAYVLSDDQSGALISTGLWHVDDHERYAAFQRVSQTARFAPGVGLPGRVLSSGKPSWIVDVTRDVNFPRARLARLIGLKAGFAFPVFEGRRVVAVLEFFAGEAVEPVPSVLEFMSHVGTTLGRATQRLHSVETLAASGVAHV